jgi:hypothetical protein
VTPDTPSWKRVRKSTLALEKRPSCGRRVWGREEFREGCGRVRDDAPDKIR